jgi:hypothetical protein
MLYNRYSDFQMTVDAEAQVSRWLVVSHAATMLALASDPRFRRPAVSLLFWCMDSFSDARLSAITMELMPPGILRRSCRAEIRSGF